MLDMQEVTGSSPVSPTMSLSPSLQGERPINTHSLDDIEVLRHSASHVLAEAVKQLYPDVKLGIGPATENGFYYDFDRETPFIPEDLEKIESRMKRIIKADVPFIKSEVPVETARDILEELGEPYKLELLDEIVDPTVTMYRNGGLTDLCRGPHLPSTGGIKAVKLLRLAGAYWRGSERNPMLQRIYGTAFYDAGSLQGHLDALEEAKKRDHRKLGAELDLYSIGEETGPGLVLWHPKGAIIRKLIEDFWRDVHLERGYDIVYTPHIAPLELWKSTGHLAHFGDMMYGAMDVDGRKYLLKPMNCPFHIQIYRSRMRSYRDLPLRYAELGTVYRYERTGVLHGLLRVRGFTQDDAHIFCTPEQLPGEVAGVIDLVKFMMQTFGYRDLEVDLSVRSPESKDDYMGTEEGWQMAEMALQEALKLAGLSWTRQEGEAVFYGPKIDVKLVDALGRRWQGPTIQFDFNLPERLGVTYIGPDGKEHPVVMVHRTVLGTMERFIGGLVEHYGGAFPPWLAPVQARVLTITDRAGDYAHEVVRELRARGIRAEADVRGEKISLKIREAELEKVPYMLVVGDREVESQTVTVRTRSSRKQSAMAAVEFSAMLSEQVRSKSLECGVGDGGSKGGGGNSKTDQYQQ